MDALITLALEFCGTMIDSRDTFLLIGILAAGLKQVHQTGKKQSACDQIHKNMDKEITGIKKDTKEALNIANKAHTCTIIMKDTMDRMEKGYNDFIEDKYKNGTKEKEIIETN